MKPLEGTFAENALKHGVAGLNLDGAKETPESPFPANVGMDQHATEIVRQRAGDRVRCFFQPKPSPREKRAGLPAAKKNSHPTVKPIALDRYLATLLLPPVRDTPRRY